MILRAYKYRAFPTKEQEVLLAKHFGTPEFQACGDKGLPLSEKQEAQPIAYGVGGYFTILPEFYFLR